MNNKYIFQLVTILAICLIINNTIKARDTDTTKTLKGISISYWGTMKHNYGLQIGLEKYYLQSEKFKIIGSASIVCQRKPDIYTSFGIIAGSTLRRTFKRGLYFEHSMKFGYLGSYYDFDMYKTNSDGKIVSIGRKWASSIIVGYSFGLGFDFSKKTKNNFQLFIKPNIYYRAPNNDNIFYLNNYSIEAGLVFHPKWF